MGRKPEKHRSTCKLHAHTVQGIKLTNLNVKKARQGKARQRQGKEGKGKGKGKGLNGACGD